MSGQNQQQPNNRGQQQQTTALATRAEFTQQQIVKASRQIMAVLPDYENKNRFMQIVLGIAKSPALRDCQPQSVLLAAYTCAKLALPPDPVLGWAYVVPFKELNESTGRKEPHATVIVGYKGFMELARRSGKVGAIRGHVRFANDFWQYEDGLQLILRHKPWREMGAKEPGQKMAAYVASRVDGEPTAKVVYADEVAAFRKRSRAANKGPWVTDEDAMWIKTAVRRQAPFWPMTPLLAKAVQVDEAADDGEPERQADEGDLTELMGGAGGDLEPGRREFGHGFGPGTRGQQQQPSGGGDDDDGGGDQGQGDAGADDGEGHTEHNTGPVGETDQQRRDRIARDAVAYGDPGEDQRPAEQQQQQPRERRRKRVASKPAAEPRQPAPADLTERPAEQQQRPAAEPGQPAPLPAGVTAGQPMDQRQATQIAGLFETYADFYAAALTVCQQRKKSEQVLGKAIGAYKARNNLLAKPNEQVDVSLWQALYVLMATDRLDWKAGIEQPAQNG